MARKKQQLDYINSLFAGGDSIIEKLPPEVREWAESLPWDQRRYVLSLSYILCGSTAEKQAEFLDDYIADGLALKMLQDIDTIQRVNGYLKDLRTQNKLSEATLRNYIKQYYIHSAQDSRRQPEQYLESALKLVNHTEEKYDIFNYILGFEMIKIMFKMSWLQHEKLAGLQTNQEIFIHTYIKPIQHAHKVNNIIVPKEERVFFAKRDFYVQVPNISVRKLITLAMATFSTVTVCECGFLVTRHLQAFRFDYDYIFDDSDQTAIFEGEYESSIH
jgi:hypothetical protein